MKKLAVVITHPIQYYVPVFRLLAQQCQLKVFYTWGTAGVKPKHDPGFGKTIAWDLPLLDSYDYELLQNVAENPGSHHRKGIINPEIIDKIEAYQPNAILVYGYMYQSHFKVMRNFKGKIPIWFRGDSTLLDEKKGFKAIAKSLYLKWVYKYVDIAFYVGTSSKAYFKKYGLKDKQLIFAPHSIDNQRFAEDRKLEVSQLRETLGIHEQDILILFAGKLEPKKNPALLLEAFIALCTNNDETDFSTTVDMTAEKEMTRKCGIHLLFVGNGVLEKQLKEKVERYFDRLSMTNTNVLNDEVVNSIHFMDFQNQTQMPVVYQACDVFCLPSQGPGETWGLAINEAMAAGKAIIASDKVGCAVDLVKDGVNGYIFKSGSVADLKAKLSLLISRTESIRSFGEQSKSIIGDWGFEQQVSQLIK
jgi:glycosyltransferase involved in cell wall biosynthesis